MASSDSKPEGEGVSMTIAAGHGYLLSRAHAAAVRLNYQNYLWRDSLGYTLHPSIPKPQNNAAIADVAAGTGMWLLDLARQVPSDAVLDGYDFNLTHAPAQAWLPKNVSFKHWNIFEPLPEEAVGKYDVVHVRLLILVFDGEDKIGPFIRNLFKMLKPGGYLQWDEIDNVRACLRKPDPDMPTPGLDALLAATMAKGRYDWGSKLQDLITTEGFVDVQSARHDDRDDLLRAFCDHNLMLMEEFASGLTRVGKHEAAEEFLSNIRLAYDESTKGPVISFPRVVVTAKKPH